MFNLEKLFFQTCAITVKHSCLSQGLIHRMLDPKTVILVFASGKLVCTGAKTETDVYRSVNLLHSMLEEKDLMMYD